MASELSAATGDTAHVLSRKSHALGRNTFIFWPSKPAILAAGLNQKITSVTSATLYRWIRLLDSESCDFELQPVTVSKVDILMYVVTPAAPAIALSDSSQLPPGDYGMIVVQGTWTSPFRPLHDLPGVHSFEKYKANNKKSPKYVGEAINLYTFPPSFEQSVQQRDEQCFITGASSSEAELGVSWIFPPTWAFKLSEGRDPRFCDFTPFITVSNAGVMRRDLIYLFHDNAFGIDVDDDYRIVVFRDKGSVMLPPRLPRCHLPTCVGPDDTFLREHFRWCLMVHLAGGDIYDDYNDNDINTAMEELGVAGSEAELASMDDDRWNTILGKEIWENIFRERLAERLECEPESQEAGVQELQ